MGLREYTISIPLRTIWNEPFYIDESGARVENTAIVQAFLNDAGFADICPGVTLTEAIYNEETRHCYKDDNRNDNRKN